MAQRIAQFKQMIGGNPRGFFYQAMASNPGFKAFIENNQGKTEQQVAREMGVDYNMFNSMLGGNNGR